MMVLIRVTVMVGLDRGSVLMQFSFSLLMSEHLSSPFSHAGVLRDKWHTE